MNDVLTTVASFSSSYWATLGVGALCAYLGVFTVLRRIVFTGAALAQAAAAGVAVSFWLLTLPLPLVVQTSLESHGATAGALLVSIGSALALARGERRGRVTADSMVGVVFAAASALSIVLVWRSSQGLVELKNILAGDVLLSSTGAQRALWLGIWGVAVVHVSLRERFLLVAYDPAFARAQGLDVRSLERVFLATLAVAVAVALRAAGLMLVFGTLVLPPLIGLRAGGTLVRATWTAVAAAWTASMLGFLLATGQNLPVAPTIVACEVLLLGLAMLAPQLVALGCAVGGVGALVLGLSLGAFMPEALPTESVEQQGEAEGRGRRRLDEGITTLRDLSLPVTRRVVAVDKLRGWGGPEALRPLLEAMNDPNLELAAYARDAAVGLGEKDACEARLRELAQGPDPELSTHAARVLVELEAEGAWSLLVERLAEPEVPLLLRDDTHVFLTEANGGDGLGYDAFASPEENEAALRAWREWAAAR